MNLTPEVNFKPQIALAHDRRTDGVTEGVTVDTEGWGGVLFVLGVGDTDGTLSVKLRDSADDSTYADVTGADPMFTALADAVGSQSERYSRVSLQYATAYRRYLRVSGSVGASSTGVDYGVTAIKVLPRDSTLANATFDKKL